jgi:hypothetical protein
MHGRIEKKVFSDYEDAKKLINENCFFGAIVDNEKSIIINNDLDNFSLLIDTKSTKSKDYSIWSYIKIFEPKELFLFENLKEATDWLYRSEEKLSEKRQATSENVDSTQYHQYPTSSGVDSTQYHQYPTSSGVDSDQHQFNVGDRVFVKDYKHPLVLEKIGFLGYSKFVDDRFLISESDILCKEEEHASNKK